MGFGEIAGKNMTRAFALMIGDIITFLISFHLAYLFRLALNQVVSVRFGTPYGFYVQMWWIPAIFLAVMAYRGLYNRRAPYWDEVGRLLQAVFIGTVAVLATLTLLKLSDRFSRLFLVLFAGWMAVLLPISRLWTKRILYKVGLWRQPLVVVAGSLRADRIAFAFRTDPFLGYEVVNILEPSALHRWVVDKETATDGELSESLGEPGAAIPRGTALAIAQEDLDSGSLKSLQGNILVQFPQVLVIPTSIQLPVLNTEPLHLFHSRMLALRITNNLLNPVSRLVKRSFDLCLLLLSLPIAVPVCLIVAVLIRMESPGPAFLKQERIGFKGRRFRFFKFRTMFENNESILQAYLEDHPEAREEWDRYKKLRGHDPRVTRIGRVLRATSMDELPQLWNVLIGNMSFVGPRPYLPRERADMADHYPLIIQAKPGLTGLWQISGRNELTFQDRLRLDRWYVTNWTLWLDVEILIKTLGVVLKRDGAY